MQTHAERFRHLLDVWKLTQEELGNLCGIKRGTVGTIVNGKTIPDAEALGELLRRKPELSPDWLLLGTGPMLRDGKNLTPIEAPQRKEPTVTQLPAADESALLKEVRQSRDKAYELLEQKQQETDRAWSEADRYRELYHSMLFNSDHPASSTGTGGKFDRSLDAAPELSIAADNRRMVVKGLLNSFQIKQQMEEYARQQAAEGVHMFVDRSGSATVSEENVKVA